MDVEALIEEIPSKFTNDLTKNKSDGQMTSSILSATSSLASPSDSGVQLLDSESDITSLMSVSGIGCDNDPAAPTNEIKTKDKPINVKLTELKPEKVHVMTKSDIDNHNHNPIFDFNSRRLSVLSSSPIETNLTVELQLEPVLLNVKNETHKYDGDLSNISLNSYELLDYTLQNTSSNRNTICDGLVDDMHVSMSEEVNESLKVTPKTQLEPVNGVCSDEIKQLQAANDEQIVFRRQRRKKSKSDTPKKRVSFHEDILNSTKIDDVHIDHGFVTRDPLSFVESRFMSKPDRYSWAAEGDTPFTKQTPREREVNSDIYIHRPRFFSTSSSSTSTSSIDEDTDAFVQKQEKLPKSSCLKKTRTHKKHIDTNVVEEAQVRKRRSENNLLDNNIFGSLKSIFNFSTSVPLAERGVPEGQEDVNLYSSSETNLAHVKRLSGEFFTPKLTEGFEITPVPVKVIDPRVLAKTNLKLTKSEGFYPNYPNNPNLPANVILCDSNVYEHKGISYSYEYEEFQKALEPEKIEKPKNNSFYQMLVNELSFFKRKPKIAEEADGVEVNATTPPKECIPEPVSSTPKAQSNLKKYASTATIDFSDETISDENTNTRHLNSPKRKSNKPNYYTHSFKSDDVTEMCSNLNSMKTSNSKNCLINRFLKNVTMRKMIELKLQKRQNNHKKYLNLYVKGAKVDRSINVVLDEEIEREIINAREKMIQNKEEHNVQFYTKVKNEVFRDYSEAIIKVYPINSAYTTSGESKPLFLTLSSSTLYISGLKPTNNYCNYFVLPYIDLNTIIIGPDAQTIHFGNYTNQMEFMISTGSSALADEIVGQLEMAMRKDLNKPQLAAVRYLSMRDMLHLRSSISKQTSIKKVAKSLKSRNCYVRASDDEEYYYYSIINMQEYNADFNEMPLGPSKEGPLMFKCASTDSRWETAYFILKAGILYMLSSPSHRLPMRVLPLINGACQGARRIYNCNRPHTFQIQVGSVTLHLAAPDEYVVSEWLQVIIHAASKTYNHREKNPTQSCSLMMTGDYILAVREVFPSTISSGFDLNSSRCISPTPQILGCASISDITSFKLPSVEQSWCVLEFSCTEVHEYSGDWVLYFATNVELERFISTLEILWSYNDKEGECFPISTIPETDSLSRRCMDTHQLLQCAWTNGQMNLQIF